MVDLIEKKLPYRKFPLFKVGKAVNNTNIYMYKINIKIKKFDEVNGIPTNAVLKAHLKIIELSEETVN
jgi:hypothetical protein